MRGILAALVTPFTPDASAIDVEATHALCDHVIASGVHGVIPGGYTGEFTSMTLAERVALTEAVVEAVARRVAVVPQTGAARTEEAVELTAHAAAIGAEAVWVSPPYAVPLPWHDIVAYYARVSEAAPGLPIMAYYYPRLVGRIGLTELDELVREVPAVCAIKDSSVDALVFDSLLAHFDGTGVAIFSGSDSITLECLASGAAGAVWGAACFMPAQAAQLFDACERGDLRAARAVWRSIRPLCRLLEETSYMAAVKAACELVGLRVGPTRPPIGPLGENARAQLASLLDAANLR